MNHESPCIHESDISILKSAMLEVKDNLKSITALLTSNAVLEEQVASLRTRGDGVTLRLAAVELALAQQKGVSRWLERVVWVLVSGGLMAALGLR